MIRLSYTLKCWALSTIFYSVFYFGLIPSITSLDKYLTILGLSTLFFPIAKRAIDVIGYSLAPNVEIFNGLLLSLLLNIIIWILTPFIATLAIIAFASHSITVLKRNLVG